MTRLLHPYATRSMPEEGGVYMFASRNYLLVASHHFFFFCVRCGIYVWMKDICGEPQRRLFQYNVVLNCLTLSFLLPLLSLIHFAPSHSPGSPTLGLSILPPLQDLHLLNPGRTAHLTAPRASNERSLDTKTTSSCHFDWASLTPLKKLDRTQSLGTNNHTDRQLECFSTTLPTRD